MGFAVSISHVEKRNGHSDDWPAQSPKLALGNLAVELQGWHSSRSGRDLITRGADYGLCENGPRGERGSVLVMTFLI